MSVALRTQSLSKAFGAFMANSDVSLSFEAGARQALIGPNGAGKTTFINLLTGFLTPTSGEVYLGAERITALPQHARVKRGMTRTFQINTLFPGLTALESVVLACCERAGRGSAWWSTVSAESAELFGVIAQLPREVTVVFIEHDMKLVFRFAERITVLVGGSVLVEGPPEEIARDARVREVYLGEAQHG